MRVKLAKDLSAFYMANLIPCDRYKTLQISILNLRVTFYTTENLATPHGSISQDLRHSVATWFVQNVLQKGHILQKGPAVMVC